MPACTHRSAKILLKTWRSMCAAVSGRPSYICRTCWKGVFKNDIGLLLPPVLKGSLGSLEGGFLYTTSVEKVKTRAGQGCFWCRILADHGLWMLSERELERPLQVRVGRDGSNSSSTDTLFCLYLNDYKVDDGYVHTKGDDPAAPYIQGRSPVHEVGSKHAILLALELMQDCFCNHDCPMPPDPCLSLPTRAIDCSNPSQPRLCITNGRCERYVALSYVWGEAQPHSTTTQNINSYIDSIDASRLPQTIVDAILTTHRLGVRYLWADTLCILQDSNEDKVHELSRMRDVYRNSYLTIIAASADRASKGFLESRKGNVGSVSLHDKVLPFVLPKVNGTVSLASSSDSKYYAILEPVHTRGWCMQEYFLPLRLLIFARHTIQYRCQKSTRNIGGADYASWVADEEPLPLHCLPMSPNTCEELEVVREAWKTIVENYTQRGISVSGDKLVAISSLAEEFHGIIQTPYLAGLWGSTLLPDLLWFKDSARHCLERPKDYRAPSWSWASVDGKVKGGDASFLNRQGSFLAEVVWCETVLERSELPFSAVAAGGVLVLCAPVVVECVVVSWGAVYRLKNLQECDITDSSIADDPSIDQEMKPRMQQIGVCRLDSSDDGFSSGVRNISVVVLHCLREFEANKRVVQGLVVEQVDEETPKDGQKKYRRIGLFDKFFEASDDVKKVDAWLDDTPSMEVTII